MIVVGGAEFPCFPCMNISVKWQVTVVCHATSVVVISWFGKPCVLCKVSSIVWEGSSSLLDTV